MSRLEWNLPQDQTFEAGLDRGVLYVEDGPAVAWNGLTSVDDGGKSAIKEFFLDGIKYLSTISPRDWEGSLSAYMYPDEFGELIGISELADGFFADSQAAGRFGLSYRTMVSTPGVSEKPDYKIHLIYKAMASLSSFSHQTLTGNTVSPNEFGFDLAAVPIIVPGLRPTSHFIFDTRKMDQTKLQSLENLIYGDESTPPILPTIEQLIDLLRYADGVTVVYNGDGTWTATGSNSNITMFNFDTEFDITNVDAEWIDPDTYKFNGLDDGSTPSLVIDEDGVPYVGPSGGDLVGIGEDTDGEPYFGPGASGLTLEEDDDGVYYVD